MTVEDSIALLRKMVKIPSVSFEEDAVADFLSDFLHSQGIGVQRFGNNLVAFNSCFRPELPTLSLDAHIDTVPPADSYTRDPYDPGDDADTVYGLGSNDDGGSVVSMIAAFSRFYGRTDLPVNIMLSLSCEEERSGPGGARLLYSSDGPLAGKLPVWTIVGEPTGMKAAVAERGLLVIDAEAAGVSGHAARGEGVNALYIALDDIAALRAHKFARISPSMGEVRLSVTQINAGTAHNVIPDKCSFVVDIRPTEQYENTEILSELQAMCRSSLKARNLTNRSSATPVSSLLYRTAERAGVEMFQSPTTSDWMRISGEAIKMGPGESSRSHRADEFIRVSEIGEAIEKYVGFITKFIDGYTLE